jgi:hypothetical protein
MKKVSKIIYAVMVAICALTISTSLIIKEYHDTLQALALLTWVGSAYFAELRCNQLQQEIDQLKSALAAKIETAEPAKSRKSRKPKTGSTTDITTPTTDAK